LNAYFTLLNTKIEEKSNSKIISPFHDIPLLANEKDRIYNMVVEIPRWTSTKFEVCEKKFVINK